VSCGDPLISEFALTNCQGPIPLSQRPQQLDDRNQLEESGHPRAEEAHHTSTVEGVSSCVGMSDEEPIWWVM